MRYIVISGTVTARSHPKTKRRQGRGEQKCTQRRLRASVRAACPKARKSYTHNQNAFGVLTDGENAGKVLGAKNQGCMRKCRLYRKRAKSACEGRCNADGKRCRTRGKSFSQWLCGRFAEGQGRGEKKKGKNPLKQNVSAGSDGR